VFVFGVKSLFVLVFKLLVCKAGGCICFELYSFFNLTKIAQIVRMTIKEVKIKFKIVKIADELQMQFDESSAYLNTVDGEVYIISDQELSAAEECDPIDDFPDWQQQNIRIAQEIISADNYIKLPSKYDVHEYAIMEEFCNSAVDSKISDAMQIAIQGKGAFGRFKDACHRFGIIDQWYSFKTEALKEIAIAWCKDNNLEYEV
jgi:hypothetical protein